MNLIGCYDKKSGELASILRLANGDKSELEPLPEAYAKHPGVIRVKAMNDKLIERARESRPELFKEPNRIGRTAAGTIRKEFRGTKLAMLGPIMIMEALLKLGYTHMITMPVAPAIMYVYNKHEFQILSEVLYDEPNEIFNLTPEEREKNDAILKEFKGGLKPGVICIVKELKLGSPLDKRN